MTTQQISQPDPPLKLYPLTVQLPRQARQPGQHSGAAGRGGAGRGEKGRGWKDGFVFAPPRSRYRERAGRARLGRPRRSRAGAQVRPPRRAAVSCAGGRGPPAARRRLWRCGHCVVTVTPVVVSATTAGAAA